MVLCILPPGRLLFGRKNNPASCPAVAPKPNISSHGNLSFIAYSAFFPLFFFIYAHSVFTATKVLLFVFGAPDVSWCPTFCLPPHFPPHVNYPND